MKKYKQKGILKKADGSSVWTSIFDVDDKIAKHFLNGKDKRVICRLNDSLKVYRALLPDGKNGWYILLNQEIIKKLNLSLNGEFDVEIWKDESKYGMPIDPAIEELLLQDTEGNEVFHSLTIGKQRSLLYLIDKPKNLNLKLRNAINILNFLKFNNGNLDFKALNEYLKTHK